MKQIFFCVNYPKYNEAIGISKKIKSQIEAFKGLGYEVTYSAYSEESILIYKNDKIDFEYKYPTLTLLSVLRRFYLMSACEKYLHSHHYDMAYIRWDAIDVSFLKVLRMLRKQCGKVLMDFHGYFPKMKAIGMKGKYIVYTTKINGHKLKKYVDYGLTETKNNKLFGINVMPIDTGIDLSKYMPHHYCGNKDELHMISVANETIYHGYDRVIYGLYEYYQLTKSSNVHLHLVGKMTEKTIDLVNKLNLQKLVHLHGYKSGADLQNIYNMCNIGIGPLAPHRVGGKEGTGIKTKEYFAIGLPYFYAGTELLVPDNYPYVFNVPSTDSPIDIQSVVSFYNGIEKKDQMVEDMRNFTKQKFSWKVIFENTIKNIYRLK